MLYNSCVVKYNKIYRAYGSFDAELCTTCWPSLLINMQIWQSIFTYILYISCVYQMQQKLQAIWCSDAVTFFATLFFLLFFFLLFFDNTVL